MTPVGGNERSECVVLTLKDELTLRSTDMSPSAMTSADKTQLVVAFSPRRRRRPYSGRKANVNRVERQTTVKRRRGEGKVLSGKVGTQTPAPAVS